MRPFKTQNDRHQQQPGEKDLVITMGNAPHVVRPGDLMYDSLVRQMRKENSDTIYIRAAIPTLADIERDDTCYANAYANAGTMARDISKTDGIKEATE